jgi:lipopolysaccharide/colanic/teichoic acid biosynthesis glycosyltransferase
MTTKRVFDFMVSTVGLIVASPFLLCCAAWVRLDSPGPAIFRQARVGRNGENFQILKFRTMRNEPDPLDPQLTVSSDSRITRAGEFLRKYKLDELPQLINVWLGEMSIVGPRPEVPRYVAVYPPSTRELVLSVRPGITDPASIEFRDENDLLELCADPEDTYVREVLPAKLAHCERYVREQGFITDLCIIWDSVIAAFRPGRSSPPKDYE